MSAHVQLLINSGGRAGCCAANADDVAADGTDDADAVADEASVGNVGGNVFSPPPLPPELLLLLLLVLVVDGHAMFFSRGPNTCQACRSMPVRLAQ